jgi:hypothetical protein
MAFTIDFLELENYVCVEITGEVSISELERARSSAIVKLRKNNCNRLLVDATLSKPKLSKIEHFEFASGHHPRFPSEVRIALIINSVDRKEFQVTEAVAKNHGVNEKVFLNKIEGINWLIQEMYD